MTNILYVNFNKRLVEQPRITSASLEENRHMTLLADKWKVHIEYFDCDSCPVFSYSKDDGIRYNQYDAWKVNKLSKLVKEYLG